jgi:hypothetical protein
VVEYTTGSAQTSLNFAAAIANFDVNGYLGFEITSSPCASGGSEYCLSVFGTISVTDAITVTPSTTYYVWIGDGFAGHFLPDVDVCLWEP